jgi:hypothetical protein
LTNRGGEEIQGEDLLKTIHMPKNLSQLVTVLPKSRYETDTLDVQQSQYAFDRQNIIQMAQ